MRDRKDFTSLTRLAEKCKNGNSDTGAILGDEVRHTQLNKHNELNGFKMPAREQVGFFHVWIRGSNRFIVFYDSEDFKGFLSRCHNAALRNETIVTAFVLMDNHVHLQVYTKALTAFMKSLLMSFNQWYNFRKGMRGQVFTSPFCSRPIYSVDYLEYNFLYILTNPVRAGMCESVKDYRWSSYHFTKAGHYNFLNRFIDVSNMVVDFLFSSNKDLNLKAIEHIEEYWTAKEAESGADKAGKSVVNKSGPGLMATSLLSSTPEKFVRSIAKPSDNEVAQYLKFVLHGRELSCLTRIELSRVMKVLRFHGNATFRQISAVTHESFNDVLRIVKEA